MFLVSRAYCMSEFSIFTKNAHWKDRKKTVTINGHRAYSKNKCVWCVWGRPIVDNVVNYVFLYVKVLKLLIFLE